MPHMASLMAMALAILGLACGPSDTPSSGEIFADGSPGDGLNSNEVPERLRHLTPLASRWGIGDDVARMEYIERSSATDRAALDTALALYHAEITAWLDSFGSTALSDEAAAFMYTQLALEEMP
jgi:hypothetical protein